MQIVFQASHKTMGGKTPTQIIQRIRAYGDSINYVLIDPSGGRGLEFDLDSSVILYSKLKERCPNLIIGFAGGFTGENVSLKTRKLIERLGDNSFCIDAEGGLRNKITSVYGDDLLDIKKVRKYLQSASSILK